MEDRRMPQDERERPMPLFNLGDRVKIRDSRGMRAKIVELRGPIGPGRVQVYRVMVRRKTTGTRPVRTYIDLMEDQIEPVPAKA
jgi:hypothetical protein